MTLQLETVTKSFGSTTVLRDVSLEIPTGSRLALVGASGSGKTTLLRLMAGFEQPDAGRIVLDGRTLAGDGRAVPAHLRGIGYVPQDGALFPHLTVARNIAFGLGRARMARRRVAELMELASLDSALADRLPHELSGGQQQRVALARTLAIEPSIVLLDEPFSALDTGLRARTRPAVIDVLERSGVSAVLVTHDQNEALLFGDVLGIVAGGTVAQVGAPADVFDVPSDLDIARFLGDVVVVPAHRVDDAQAWTPLGLLPVRHCFGDGGVATGMLRPDQIRVTPGAGSALITSVRHRGAHADVCVQVAVGDGSTLELTQRVPARDALDYRPGAPAAVAVSGGVVLYAAPADSHAVR
jgi:iron(III) transport system ATP-binding protein